MAKRERPLPTMGPLETEAMSVLWNRPERHLKVREVAELLDRDVAYTTVLTLLVRLHAKGLLVRKRVGNAWAYRPAVSRSGYAAAAMSQVLHTSDDAPGVLLRFVDELTREELAALRDRLRED